jgi:two-component system chemotaxis response regulator CheB
LTPAAPYRVLVVDDSATMRALIRGTLSREPRLAVVGEASDPLEARAALARLAPDVLTLDIEMPRMDGLAFLEQLMRLRPMPVVMLSSLTQAGSRAAVEALAAGAVDAVGKPSGQDGAAAFRGLAERVLAAARAKVRARPRPGRTAPPEAGTRETARVTAGRRVSWNGRVVLIGASTGGVDAIETVLEGFPPDCPPTLIVQHMPESFLRSFAARLDARMAPEVCLASDGLQLRPGLVCLAPGGAAHLRWEPGLAGAGRCRLVAGPPRCGHRPSVDVLFESARTAAPRAAAALLTGMGRDGAEGLAVLAGAGGQVFAQDAESCVVYGMPRAAVELGAVPGGTPLSAIGAELLRACAEPLAAGRAPAAARGARA